MQWQAQWSSKKEVRFSLEESEESAEVPVHRDKRRADDQLQGTAFRQRGEVLPRFDPCAAHGNAPMLVTRGELLPQDAKALETDSETEQETPGLSSLTSAATPWQRRVKKREKREPDRGSEAREPSRGSAEVLSQPAVLHGMASIRGVPRGHPVFATQGVGLRVARGANWRPRRNTTCVSGQRRR